jgi:ankyrin repeat protein
MDALVVETTSWGIKSVLADLEKNSHNTQDDKQSKKLALNHAYHTAMRRISSQPLKHKRLAEKVLSWVTCAKQQLSPIQLQIAITVETGMKTLDKENTHDIGLAISVCAGLIVLDEERDVVRPVHYTTQEYFEQNWRDWIPEAHTQITETCIVYLSSSMIENGYSYSSKNLVAMLRLNPLLCYAAKFWAHHAKIASMDGTKPVIAFLQNSENQSFCAQAIISRGPQAQTLHLHEIPRIGITGIHLAASFGLTKSLSMLLKLRADINLKDISGHTPLLSAAKNGHYQVVRLLLKQQKIDTEAKDILGRTPLLWAAKCGHNRVVELLLQKHADVEATGNVCSMPGWFCGTSHLASLEWLLDNDNDIDRDHDNGRTPLLWAVQGSHYEVVSLLLTWNANVEARDSFGRTSLSVASEIGHKEIVKLLIGNEKVHIDGKDKDGWSPLFWAAKKGHKDVVEMLLVNGANPNAKDDCGRTALYWAANKGHAGVFTLLYTLEADSGTKNTPDNSYLLLNTMDGWADVKCICGRVSDHETVAGLILDQMTDVESKDLISRTALILAVKWGLPGMFRLLLDRGANPDVKNSNGDTAFMYTVALGWTEIVRLILTRKVDPAVTSTSLGEALVLAAMAGHDLIVGMLLAKNADKETSNEEGETPLISAAQRGHMEAVKVLFDNGADVEARDKQGHNALHWATKGGHESVVKLLLDNGADVEATDKQGHNALHWATKGGHESVVKLLLDNGADVEATDKQGHNALHCATKGGHESVVKLLLDNGADVEARDKRGHNALHWATKGGHQSVVKLLFDNGLPTHGRLKGVLRNT